MSKYTKGPWMAVDLDGGRLVVDTDGAPICALPTIKRSAEEVAANAELIALAPELFRAVCELVAVMRASDVESEPFQSLDSDTWDAALDEAQALIDLLADEGVTPEEAADGVVVIPVRAMQPPVVVTAFKSGNGDIGFIVHADDEHKTFIGQYGIAPPLFPFARTFLQANAPFCGVLRGPSGVVGEIAFLPGPILKLRLFMNTSAEQVHSVELAQADIDDIVSLFREA